MIRAAFPPARSWGVDQPDRDTLSGFIHGELEVAVSADYDGGVDALFTNVEQEVCCDVHVGALFLASRI